MRKLSCLIILFLFISCGITNESSVKETSNSDNQITLTGKFESKKGVMHKISCHGFNIGYLIMDSKKVVICFDRLKNSSDLQIDCENLEVSGNFEQHEIQGEENGVCSASKMELFFVTDWKCL